MRIANTDNYKNKICTVTFKDATTLTGKIIFIPNYSEKYNYHPVGWFIQVPDYEFDMHLKFKDILDIEVEGVDL